MFLHADSEASDLSSLGDMSFCCFYCAVAHFMAVNLLIRKCIDVIDDFATTDANGIVSDHCCLKFTAYMIKLVSKC